MPIKRKIEPFIQPIFLIKAFGKIDTTLLKAYIIAFRKVDKEIFIVKFVKKEEEALANQVFIEQSILFKDEFINSNAESKIKELVLSNTLKLEKLRIQPSNQAIMQCKTR